MIKRTVPKPNDLNFADSKAQNIDIKLNKIVSSSVKNLEEKARKLVERALQKDLKAS